MNVLSDSFALFNGPVRKWVSRIAISITISSDSFAHQTQHRHYTSRECKCSRGYAAIMCNSSGAAKCWKSTTLPSPAKTYQSGWLVDTVLEKALHCIDLNIDEPNRDSERALTHPTRRVRAIKRCSPCLSMIDSMAKLAGCTPHRARAIDWL
jgi:hypothetical protein